MIDTVKDQMETLVPKQMKKAYQSPELVAYGTVAELTAHVSTGMAVFDSAQSAFRSS